MVQKFKQIIYYNADSNFNFPTTLTVSDLESGAAFNAYLPLTQLGIRALPGTKFYINGSDTPVIVGFTGLFELDLTQGGVITSLTFDSESLNFIEQNNSAYLIVDMAYLGGS